MLFRSVPFDGAILDCNIGTEKVWSVADYLMGKGVPILFATGGNSDEIPERFADCPSLEKPYTMGNVEIALAELLVLDKNSFSYCSLRTDAVHAVHALIGTRDQPTREQGYGCTAQTYRFRGQKREYG